MAVDLDHFCRLRPFLYHLTATTNLGRIFRVRRIYCASLLYEQAGVKNRVIAKRSGSDSITIGRDKVSIRDQDPLHQGNMALQPECSYADFLEILNARVFFWPGTETGPIPSGLRHFARYQAERPTILRVRTADILTANPKIAPDFCRFNSGSPRWTNGTAAPRGRQTFVSAENADFGAARVIEVTFPRSILLPAVVQTARNPAGPWRARK
jgi:hypothetical protein